MVKLPNKKGLDFDSINPLVMIKFFLLSIFEGFSLFSNHSNLLNMSKKSVFFFKQMRIAPEIDFLYYKRASPAKMYIVLAELEEF